MPPQMTTANEEEFRKYSYVLDGNRYYILLTYQDKIRFESRCGVQLVLLEDDDGEEKEE